MIDYILRRLGIGLVTLFGGAVMVFVIMRVLPGEAKSRLGFGGES